MTRAAWIAALLVAVVAGPARAQQASIQIGGAAQVTTGDPWRLGGQHPVEPDLIIQLFDPGFRFGNLYADLNVTRRDDRAVIGRAVFRLDGAKAGGLTWSLDTGDTFGPPAVQNFGFSNLFAPVVTFQGGSLRGVNARTEFAVSAGRVTAQRNIFGTDTTPIGQALYQVSLLHRLTPRLELQARGIYVHSGEMQMYTAFTDRATDVGGGVRFRAARGWQLVTDGGLTAFQRRGAPTLEYAPTGLVGSIWSFGRGWVQLNAQQFSLGHFPVANFPYNDRSGVFASGEVDLHATTRLFGGGEYAKSNLDPAASDAATVGIPPGFYSRGYGGVRVRVASQSTLTFRVDGGGREIRPSKFSAGFESDTGVITAEWQARFSRASIFTRYERRSNVDPNSTGASFTQHDGNAQFYLTLPGGRQLFALAYLSSRADDTGGGETLWQTGGGTQLPIGPLYLRAEGTVGRTRDWGIDTARMRQTLAVGLSGRIADRTYLSVDCFIDHSPLALVEAGSPWMTRTMIRLTRAFPFGTARSKGAAAPGRPVYTGATGRINGTVFVDWNGNGVMDPGEPPVGGIAFSLGPWGTVTAGQDGRFEFGSVPVGPRTVTLDVGSVPADFDPPAGDSPTVAVARNQTSSVTFGLIPLGTVHGIVYQDADGDGTLSPADTPIDRAVLVLDDGARTELTRDGAFRFDSIRMGKHTVALLTASLPDGAQLVGEPTRQVELGKDVTPDKLVFLVKLEKRPEVRKVFPAKKK